MERVKQDGVEHSRPNIERSHREAGPVNRDEGNLSLMQDSLADIQRQLDGLHALVPQLVSQDVHTNDSSELQILRADEALDELERRQEGAGERLEANRRSKAQSCTTGDVHDFERRQAHAEIRREANQNSDYLRSQRALGPAAMNRPMERVKRNGSVEHSQVNITRNYREMETVNSNPSFSMQDFLVDLQRKLDSLHARLPPPSPQAAHPNGFSEVQIPRAHEESNQLERRKEGAGERLETDHREKEQPWNAGDVQRFLREDPKCGNLDHEGRQTHADIRMETNRNSNYLHSQRFPCTAPTNRPMERVKQDSVEHSRANIQQNYREGGPVDIGGHGVRHIALKRRHNDVESARQKQWDDAENPGETSRSSRHLHSPEPQSFRLGEVENINNVPYGVEHDSTGRDSERERMRNAASRGDFERKQRLQRYRAKYERTRQEANYRESDQYFGHFHPRNPQPTHCTVDRNPNPFTPSSNDGSRTPDSFRSQNSRRSVHFQNTFPFAGQYNHFHPLLYPSPLFVPSSVISWPALPTFQPPWYESGHPGHPAYGGFSSISGGHNVYVNSPVNENSGNTFSVTVTDTR
ncbi:hypothetical protein H0H92_000909 [Tricholoma furcatifolium]|nr:hypothetical protein H0H92_000909 [Tricholoma furcatifolium]